MPELRVLMPPDLYLSLLHVKHPSRVGRWVPELRQVSFEGLAQCCSPHISGDQSGARAEMEAVMPDSGD